MAATAQRVFRRNGVFHNFVITRRGIMKIIGLTGASLVVFILFSGAASAQSQKEQLKACVDKGFSDLIAQRSQNFTSPEYRVTCPQGDIVGIPPRCRKHDRNNVFTYEAPSGFRIAGPSFNISSQTARTSISRQLSSDGVRASIGLQCGGHGCDGKGSVWIAGNIVGRLAYQPTAEDAKAITDRCLDQILQ